MLLAVAAIASQDTAAQKNVKFDFSASEARVLDLEPQTYVKPLIAEVEVDVAKGRVRDTWTLTADEYNSRVIQGDDESTIKNLQVYGVFKSAEKHNCDIIVAATFDVRISVQGAVINVVGFPANFTNWATGTVADFDWINMVTSSKPAPTETIPFNATISK